MKRLRFKQHKTLGERLIEGARAEHLPPGKEREVLLRRCVKSVQHPHSLSDGGVFLLLKSARELV
ncbi:hypothetical protein D6B98_37965 [Bradyrhizobium sp. LVM 105]|uniref:Uncharacterized protein n=1 Tax=Bradyrhizobium frederickii TaxID=2560054 RepID=A0A4Y9KUE1_9BRAD|nr:hypothetical protein D6B98_37965 [Bradyrhizobium sp. LVM 105]TFV29550.1 hypothetical protein E4K66_37330 [Bradyrhizobium frederickii]TFV68077.1 hypothetical protein E4K64_37450 [Bradyrhizobium frederickii]